MRPIHVPAVLGVALIASVVVLATAWTTPTRAGWEYYENQAELFVAESHFDHLAVASDGFGGMLVATIDPDVSPSRCQVSRVDHNGTEVWGNEGSQVLWAVGQQNQLGPLAVAHDGAGGAWVAYHARYDGFYMLWLAHVDADGTCDRVQGIDNLGAMTSGEVAEIRMLPVGPHDALLVWKQFGATPRLYAARADLDGFVWHDPVTSTAVTDNVFRLVPDGQGGALVGYHVPAPPGEIRAQRIRGTDGVLLWNGLSGALAWGSSLGAFGDIARDGSGGAFLVRSDAGVTYAQHLDATGSPVWGSELTVHDSQTPWFSLSTAPELCADGQGGFVMVHGIEDLHVQRVAHAGTLVWGPTGVTVAAPVMIGGRHDIAPDRTGGAVVTYATLYDIDASTQCRQADAARVDGDGTVVWNRLVGGCEWSWGPTSAILHAEPHSAHPVADESDGALLAWKVHDVDDGDDLQIWGYGVDAVGAPPTPRVSSLVPDAAEPDATVPYAIAGDYLDLGLEYRLVHERGAQTVPLNPVDLQFHRMVTGTTTLTNPPYGAYHLIVSDAVADRDTLHHALGIGDPVPCATDIPFLPTYRAVSMDGSQRQAVYDSEGRLHTLWIEHDADRGEDQLELWTYDGAWNESEPIATSVEPFRGPTLAIDDDGMLHAFVTTSWQHGMDALWYRAVTDEASVVRSDVYQHDANLRDPVAACTEDGLVHVVVEAGTDPMSHLLHLVDDGDRLDVMTAVTSGDSPRDPDLVAVGDGLELVFRRDGSEPGTQQIEHAGYAPGGWSAPDPLTLGLELTSPSVAFDGEQRLLYAWILDNEAETGIPAQVITQLRVDGGFEPPRIRPGATPPLSVTVAGAEPGRFLLLTSESSGGPAVEIFLRAGDGNVFFPRERLNVNTDVSEARLAVHRDSPATAAYWHDHGDPASDVHGCLCERTVTSTPPPPPALDTRLRARPNPFNATVEFGFELDRTSTVRLEIHDLRGRLVRHLWNGTLPAGARWIGWDGRDDTGSLVASGVYVGRLVQGDDTISVRKVALVE